jgi:hypothetical protein
MAFRASAKLRSSIVKWAENQRDKPSLSESVCRLVELGLSIGKPQVQTPGRISAKAKHLAGQALDSLADPGATIAEQADRKLDLIKGPDEFRNVRVDHRNKK